MANTFECPHGIVWELSCMECVVEEGGLMVYRVKKYHPNWDITSYSRPYEHMSHAKAYITKYRKNYPDTRQILTILAYAIVDEAEY